mmetsp:Transcript_15722/g.34416  ORF Transcript_15722/g.34416 Transcript_15722/m.34416 type:complete len:330 (-) Transcript_15722:180-1169(-)
MFLLRRSQRKIIEHGVPVLGMDFQYLPRSLQGGFGILGIVAHFKGQFLSLRKPHGSAGFDNDDLRLLLLLGATAVVLVGLFVLIRRFFFLLCRGVQWFRLGRRDLHGNGRISVRNVWVLVVFVIVVVLRRRRRYRQEQQQGTQHAIPRQSSHARILCRFPHHATRAGVTAGHDAAPRQVVRLHLQQRLQFRNVVRLQPTRHDALQKGLGPRVVRKHGRKLQQDTTAGGGAQLRLVTGQRGGLRIVNQHVTTGSQGWQNVRTLCGRGQENVESVNDVGRNHLLKSLVLVKELDLECVVVLVVVGILLLLMNSRAPIVVVVADSRSRAPRR